MSIFEVNECTIRKYDGKEPEGSVMRHFWTLYGWVKEINFKNIVYSCKLKNEEELAFYVTAPYKGREFIFQGTRKYVK